MLPSKLRHPKYRRQTGSDVFSIAAQFYRLFFVMSVYSVCALGGFSPRDFGEFPAAAAENTPAECNLKRCDDHRTARCIYSAVETSVKCLQITDAWYYSLTMGVNTVNLTVRQLSMNHVLL